MTTVTSKFLPALPSVHAFFNPLIDSIKEHGGKAIDEVVRNETIMKLAKQYNFRALSPKIELELRYRLERAMEVLIRSGLIGKRGEHTLTITSKALVLSKEEIDSFTTAKQEKLEAPIEVKPYVLPLPDEIALQIVELLKEERLSALEIEEHALKSFAHAYPAMSENSMLDIVRRRTLTARRILQLKKIIEPDGAEHFVLTMKGRCMSNHQIEQATCCSLGALLKRFMLKLRLKLDTHAHIEARNIVLHELIAFCVGAFRHVCKRCEKTGA